jgi:hypothetical protein
VARLCPSLVLLVTGVEWLDIGEGRSNWQDAADRTQWLEQPLHPFIAVRNLRLSRRLGPLTLPEEVVPEIFPALHNVFSKGLGSHGSSQFVQEVEPFVASRQV